MHSHHPYSRLVLMTVLSFIAMYVLMYAMVDSFQNVYANINQIYMAGLMTAPMVMIELLVMGAMYQNRKANIVIFAVSAVALAACFVLIRTQAGVADEQFLRSMIPHHSGAILMCNEAPIQDAEIKELCAKIIAGQRSEIDQMRAKLGAIAK